LLRGEIPLAHYQRAERVAGTDLDQDRIRALEELHRTVAKTHGLPQLAAPVVRIARLGLPEPSASGARHKGDARRCERELPDEGAEGRKNPVHHARVK